MRKKSTNNGKKDISALGKKSLNFEEHSSMGNKSDDDPRFEN
ncbi:MAG: hypothetical protein O4751_11205 [Trichodesmium sp. St2_bin6]|nr:hypothetical protein [Trichodesmium sp. St2_bin6]